MHPLLTYNRWNSQIVPLSKERSSRMFFAYKFDDKSIRAKYSPILHTWPFANNERQHRLSSLLKTSLIAICSRMRGYIFSVPFCSAVRFSFSQRINVSDETWFTRAELFSSLVVESLLAGERISSSRGVRVKGSAAVYSARWTLERNGQSRLDDTPIDILTKHTEKWTF